MKSQVEEFFYLIAIATFLLLIIIFLIHQKASKGVEVKMVVRERTINEGIATLVLNLFNTKLPIVEKSYVEIGIDAILDGENLDEVIYGVGVGKVNVSEMILQFLDKYMRGKLEVTIVTPGGSYTYGKINEKEKIYVYESLIPVPEEETGKIVVRMGGIIQ